MHEINDRYSVFEKPEDRTNFTWPEDHGYFNVKIAEITAGEFKPETMPVDSNTWNMMASAPIAEFVGISRVSFYTCYLIQLLDLCTH